MIEEVEQRFAQVFGRQYSGLVEAVQCEDADYVLVTLGSAAGLVRTVVESLRAQGLRVGLLRIRYLRPLPTVVLAAALGNAKAVAVLEKDVSFGAEGTVFTNVNSALQQAGVRVPTYDFIGGLGGDDITPVQVEAIFRTLVRFVSEGAEVPRVSFLGIDGTPGDAASAASPKDLASDACRDVKEAN